MTDERAKRLRDELNEMRHLADGSSILKFESVGESPELYRVHFYGKLITRESSVSPIEFTGEHSCDIRLPFSFPETAPDIRFTSTVYHPNIAAGGFVDLNSLGLQWSSELTLAVVCERLWDACRLATFDVEQSTNISAEQWLDDERQISLPTDERPLRDLAEKNCSNVIRYKRRAGGPPRIISPVGSAPDILYIGDESVETPSGTEGAPAEDIFYIGEDIPPIQ
jgi:ubiquitin-protein ligase